MLHHPQARKAFVSVAAVAALWLVACSSQAPEPGASPNASESTELRSLQYGCDWGDGLGCLAGVSPYACLRNGGTPCTPPPPPPPACIVNDAGENAMAFCNDPPATVHYGSDCDLSQQYVLCNPALAGGTFATACPSTDPNVLQLQAQLTAAGCLPGLSNGTGAVVCFNPSGTTFNPTPTNISCPGIGNLWWYAYCPASAGQAVAAMVNAYAHCFPILTQSYSCGSTFAPPTGYVVYYDPQCHSCTGGGMGG